MDYQKGHLRRRNRTEAKQTDRHTHIDEKQPHLSKGIVQRIGSSYCCIRVSIVPSNLTTSASTTTQKTNTRASLDESPFSLFDGVQSFQRLLPRNKLCVMTRGCVRVCLCS
jgi:hypothetical protein